MILSMILYTCCMFYCFKIHTLVPKCNGEIHELNISIPPPLEIEELYCQHPSQVFHRLELLAFGTKHIRYLLKYRPIYILLRQLFCGEREHLPSQVSWITACLQTHFRCCSLLQPSARNISSKERKASIWYEFHQYVTRHLRNNQHYILWRNFRCSMLSI